MSAQDVLTNPHTGDRWTTAAVLSMSGQLESDAGLAGFVAAAPAMARALKAVLNLDLGDSAERLVRAEINAVLRTAGNPAGSIGFSS
jgi:hypothetical protein